MNTNNEEDLSIWLLSKKEARDLIYWKMLCKKYLEEYEFEAMMIRKYATCSFYKKCRAMTLEQLNERLWKINESHIPYNILEIEKAERKLYMDHQARELLQSSMKPYQLLLKESLIQKELFV